MFTENSNFFLQCLKVGVFSVDWSLTIQYSRRPVVVRQFMENIREASMNNLEEITHNGRLVEEEVCMSD